MKAILNAGRIAIILVVALPLVAAAQSTAQPPAPPSLWVVPGLGVGQWTLDEKVADYIWVMGDSLPFSVWVKGDSVIADTRLSGTDLVFRPQLLEKSWPTPRIFVVYPPGSNDVWAVGTADPGARTIDRAGIGSTEQQVTAAYQDPQMVLELPLRSRTLIYDNRGIAFEFAYLPSTGQYSPSAGRVFVFRSGQGRAIWRLP
jgi:hypothetical protein